MPVCRKGNRSRIECYAFCDVCWRRFIVRQGTGNYCSEWCEFTAANPIDFDTRNEIERRRAGGDPAHQGGAHQGELSL